MAVTFETPIASLRATISVWFANGSRLIAARQAQANARIAQHLKELEARKQATEN